MRAKKEKEQVTNCPYCGASVKEKNLPRHLHKVHAWRVRKATQAKTGRIGHGGYAMRKWKTTKLALLATGLIAVSLVGVYAYINAQSDVAAPSTIVYEDPETGYVSNLTVKLLNPTEGETLSGVVVVRWQAVGGNDEDLRIIIQYSTDPPPWCALCPRQRWHNLATNLKNDGVYEWDTTQFPNGGYTLKILVSDGKNTAEYRSGVFTVKN